MKPSSSAVFFRKSDLFILLAVLLAAALWWFFSGRSTGTVAEISVGVDSEQRVTTVPLSKDAIINVEGAPFPVTLEVKDGAIRFINSQCPDHRCEGFGWLRRDGEWALCAPARVYVRVVDPS